MIVEYIVLMNYSYQINDSFFHIRTPLIPKRKAKIIEWVNSLPEHQREMIDQIHKDGIEHGKFDSYIRFAFQRRE